MSGIAPFTSSDQTSLTTTDTSSDNTSATSFYYRRRDGQVWLKIKLSPGACWNIDSFDSDEKDIITIFSLRFRLQIQLKL